MKILESTKEHKKHFTVTGYVTTEDKGKLLLIHHKKLNKWLPPGGHLEENEIPHEGAMREVLEETGLAVTLAGIEEHDFSLRNIVDMQIPRPYALMYQIIPENSKDVEHIHLDMVYIFVADEYDSTLEANQAEVYDVKWLTAAEILKSDDVFDSVKGFAKSYMKV